MFSKIWGLWPDLGGLSHLAHSWRCHCRTLIFFEGGRLPTLALQLAGALRVVKPGPKNSVVCKSSFPFPLPLPFPLPIPFLPFYPSVPSPLEVGNHNCG